jgi:hypothetical protein
MRRSSARNVLRSRIDSYFYLKTTAGGSTRALEFTYKVVGMVWSFGASVLICGALLFSSQTARAQLIQQGSKLVGTLAVGAAQQGNSIALSADGNTAVVGGFADNSYTGAAWVFVRNNGVWTQQGHKLVANEAIWAGLQGYCVALSADGITAIVGAPHDNADIGAARVYTRSSGVWTQQGSKLVGAGAVGATGQGWSAALSADGNTAIVGGYGDNTFTGAVWVYTRNGKVWTQQGSELVGNSAVGHAQQGSSIAVSADGNTAIVGGHGDNSYTGAAWVYTRSGNVWTQQGSKLVGNGADVGAEQGISVALSADGNTAIVGGPNGTGGGVDLHAQRQCLDPAGQQAGRKWRGWSSLSGPRGRPVPQRQHCHRGRVWR